MFACAPSDSIGVRGVCGSGTCPDTGVFWPISVAAAGDNEDTFVRKMKGVERPRDLFRALNDLPAGAPIAAGTRVKVVNDD